VTSVDLSGNAAGSETAQALVSAKCLDAVLLSETARPGGGAGPGASAESATNLVK